MIKTTKASVNSSQGYTQKGMNVNFVVIKFKDV